VSEPLGLFPLPLVLVPTERIPLHIFEDRYRELIGECLEEGIEFGFVRATGDGAVHEIGTRAWVAEVLDELDDGRMNIVVEGRERFRLLELTSGRSFTTGLVEAVVDDDEPAAPADIEQALALFGTLVEISDADVDLPGPETPQLDFELAARVDFGVDAKQELLATTSPRRRMERLVALLDQAIELLRIEQTMRERASRNGKITHADHGSGSDSDD
jgi:Lon protease-like protein